MTAFGSLRRPLLGFLLVVVCVLGNGQPRPARSVITIHVGKTGLFSGFGHEHTVLAPIASGRVDQKAPSVRITVLTAQMKVVDSDVSDKDRAEVQDTMLGPKVLDGQRFPEIRFQSSRVQPAGGAAYRVTGMLSLHGATREVSFEVSGTPEHYHGKTRVKQTEFGIKPVTAGGGAVKVKDELELEFDVYPADLAPSISR